jgi:sugar phosphate isomerase/epimerase
MVLGSPKQRDLLPGVGRAAGVQYAVEVLRAVEPTLEQTGVVIALEPLAPKTTNFLTTAAEGAELIQRVATAHCRLHLDCLAMSTETIPIPDLIRKHRAMLAHFHANDPNGQGPGFGQLDFVPILKTLREIDYRGWVSVEVFDYKPGGERLARQSIRYLRQCASQLGL